MKVRNGSSRLHEVVAPNAIPVVNSQRAVVLALKLFITKDVLDPSYAQLSMVTGLNAKTAQRAVLGLENRGLIVVIKRHAPSGFQVSNRYELTPSGEALVSKIDALGALIAVDNCAKHKVGRSAGHFAGHKEETSCPAPNAFDDRSIDGQLQLTSKLSEAEKDTAMSMLTGLPNEAAQQIADELRERIFRGGIERPLAYLAKLIGEYKENRFYPVLAGAGAKKRLESSGC